MPMRLVGSSDRPAPPTTYTTLSIQYRRFRLLVWILGYKQTLTLLAARLGRKLLSRPEPAVLALRCRDIPTPVYIRPKSTDWPVFEEIFVEGGYAIPSKPHGNAIVERYESILAKSRQPIIIDCGANIGLASAWFAMNFPHAKIFAVEPDPSNFAVLIKNCAQFGAVVPIQAAISDRPGNVGLKNRTGQAWAVETIESSDGQVPTTTIEYLAREPNSELLIVKIDIEGFEKVLFRSNTGWTTSTPLIVIETHDWLFPWSGTAHAVLSALCREPRDYLQHGEKLFAFSHDLQRQP